MELLRTGRADIEVAELKELVAETLFPGNGPRDDPKEVTWAAYYERYALGKRTRSYRKSCLYTLAKMRHLCEGFHSLRFGDITLAWLRDVDARLTASGMSVNTRNIHFKNIRTCLNRAIDEELTDNYPFRRFKIRPEATRKRNLPVGELRRLFGYGVEPYQEYYLDYFKLIFMLVGINAIDLFRLTAVENGRVEYRRAKTHKLYSVKVEPEAQAIIDRHRGKRALLDAADRWSDHRDFVKNCNIALQKIGTVERHGLGGSKEIVPEWPGLTTYWARHTWATVAYSIDIPKDIISQALGHSSGSAVTEIYIERDLRRVDEANRRVLDWVLYGRR